MYGVMEFDKLEVSADIVEIFVLEADFNHEMENWSETESVVSRLK